ncbi:MAG: glycerophosphodiester phosphodiesterase family protein [Thermoanaerobaculia bacterium]
MRSSVGAAAILLLGLACAGSAPRAPREPFDAQGHRGARGLLPENTLPAFRRALELGVSTLELDTGVTADGVIVVSHNRRLSGEICLGPAGERLANEEGPLIRDLTLAEVRRFDCGSLNPSRRRFPEPPRQNLPGTPVPTLAEVFELADDLDPKVRLNIEMKVDPTVDETLPLEQFAAAMVDLVVEHGVVERAIIQCFDWRGLELVKSRRPELTTAALLSPETLDGGGPSPWLNGLSLDAAGGTSLDLVAGARGYVDIFSPYWRQVTPGAWGYLDSTVEEIQAAGFPVVPWTVNSAERIEGTLDLGVDGLISDYPDRLLEILRRRGIRVL